MEDQGLLIATSNRGKLRELEELLDGLNIRLISLADVGPFPEIEETGATFIENARQKAVGYARLASKWALADDSGLEVDALGGRPGVLSARYGGDISFEQKIARLLKELENTGDLERRARFVCAVALAAPDGTVVTEALGQCSGTIAFAARGTHGFGYDPIFVPDGSDETFAEFSAPMKQAVSHRRQALIQIIPILRRFSAILT